MGGPKPWPTRWPEPSKIPYEPDDLAEPYVEPEYDIEEDPQEKPHRLPENQLVPYSVTWGVTHPCNLRCSHCYDIVDYRRSDLTTKQAMEVINRLAQVGIKFIVFSGGEPLLRKDLLQLMTHCRKYDLDIGMRSNGTLIESTVARRLAALDLAVAGISLDGATAQSHDAIRGKGSFQKTMTGIKELLAAGIRVNVEVVLSRRNAAQCLGFIQLAQDFGVDEINFSAIAPQGLAQQMTQDMLDYGLWQELTATLYNASLTTNIDVSPSCALTGACWACVEPNITCDGWVTPCYLSKHKLFHILDTPPAEIKTRLKQDRPATLDICGRGRWMRPLTGAQNGNQVYSVESVELVGIG